MTIHGQCAGPPEQHRWLLSVVVPVLVKTVSRSECDTGGLTPAELIAVLHIVSYTHKPGRERD